MAALAAEHDCQSDVAKSQECTVDKQKNKTRSIWLPLQDYQVLESLVLMPGVSLDRPDRHAGPYF